MNDSARFHAAAWDGGLDIALLDAGEFPISMPEIRRVILSVLTGATTEFARDRNSTCYCVPLSAGTDVPAAAVVKVPRAGPQRTNDDVTFSREAQILASLPKAGIPNTYQLLARIRAGDTHYLLTTHLPGAPPDPILRPLGGGALQGLFDSLFLMDRQGLMHYDLKPANILLDGDRHGFIDFEFGRFESWHDAYAPATANYCEDYNVSSNPHFPSRTNVANFEFRTLAQYLVGLRQGIGPADADNFFRAYLRERSGYHRRMGRFLADLPRVTAERIAARGAIATPDAFARLAKAASYEHRLAALLHDACSPVADFERSLIVFRQDIFEHRREAAHTVRMQAFERSARSLDTQALPADYVEAMARTFERVWRSPALP